MTSAFKKKFAATKIQLTNRHFHFLIIVECAKIGYLSLGDYFEK